MRPMSEFDLRGGGGGGGRSGRTAAGCLSRMLRRILCFSSLPLCAFDRLKEDERESSEGIGATPRVVVRLMGLDSLPRLEENRVDSLETSRSPRCDIPAYRELEDENFFILSFEKRRGSRRRKSCRRRENKENENPKKVIENCQKDTKKLGKEKCLAAAMTFKDEDDSENSSPNSVLEFVGFAADQESASLGGISRLTNSKMRRPLSEELENCRDSQNKIMINGLDLEGGNLIRLHSNSERLGEVGKMAAMETMGSRWLHDELLQSKHCFMEIGREITSSILDHLLEELVVLNID